MTWTEPPEHGSLITPDHPGFRHWHDRAVWGALAQNEEGRPKAKDPDNPFRDFDFARNGAKLEHGGGWDLASEADPDTVDRFHSRYRRHLEHAHPAIAVPTHAVSGIAHDKRLKSQFESGESGGWYEPELRAQDEMMQFGYEHHHPRGARPVYGFLTRHPYTDRSSEVYGDHTFVLNKPSVWHRTTFMGADTKNSYNQAIPAPVQQYHRHAVPLAHFGLDARTLGKTPPEQRRQALATSSPEDLADRFWSGQHRNSVLAYPEAQYHGGVRTRDIHYAILRSHQRSGMDDEVAHHAAHLTRAGIPWVHTNGWRRPVDDDPHFRPRRGEASR